MGLAAWSIYEEHKARQDQETTESSKEKLKKDTDKEHDK